MPPFRLLTDQLHAAGEKAVEGFRRKGIFPQMRAVCRKCCRIHRGNVAKRRLYVVISRAFYGGKASRAAADPEFHNAFPPIFSIASNSPTIYTAPSARSYSP